MIRRTVNSDGTACYRNERGDLHRLDGPALEYVYGDKFWYVNGKRHRLDGPAVEDEDGNREWWVHGKRHRLDGPAIERSSGYSWWYVYGKSDFVVEEIEKLQKLNAFLKFTLLQNKSRKFNEWLFDPDHYAGKWHKKNMLRDFQ